MPMTKGHEIDGRTAELALAVLDALPFPVQVFSPDGFTVHMNQTFLSTYGISDAGKMVGQFNVFEDRDVTERGLLDHVKRAFLGETTLARDILVPLDRLAPKFWMTGETPEAEYADIMMYPVFDSLQSLSYVVSVILNRRCHMKKPEIQRGLDYMAEHWMDPFDVDSIAQAAGMSRTHFSRLFHHHVGQTLHDHYMETKVRHLQEALVDEAVSISQAFAKCGVDYSGHYARIFRNQVGMTPSQYRRRHLK